jgi:alkylhydroperoxidase family enzyme
MASRGDCPGCSVCGCQLVAVAAEFSPAEVAALLAVVVAINSWNRIAVTTRAWEPGSYQP